MKKVFAISMTLAIVATLGLGCGKGSSDTTTSALPTSSAAVTTTKATTTSSTPSNPSTAAVTSGTFTSTTPPTTTAKTTTSVPPTTSTPAATGNDLTTLLGKAAAYSNYSCDVTMTSSSGNSTSKYWIKMGTPTMFKMESTAGGLTSDTIFNGTQYYLYTPSTNTAIAMTVPPPKPGDANSTTQYNPVYIGSKTVNGYACAGYQYTTSGVQTTMWVSTQYGVTVEMTSSSGTIDYSNFNFAALPDSTFQLPAGCIIMTIPGM